MREAKHVWLSEWRITQRIFGNVLTQHMHRSLPPASSSAGTVFQPYGFICVSCKTNEHNNTFPMPFWSTWWYASLSVSPAVTAASGLELVSSDVPNLHQVVQYFTASAALLLPSILQSTGGSFCRLPKPACCWLSLLSECIQVMFWWICFWSGLTNYLQHSKGVVAPTNGVRPTNECEPFGGRVGKVLPRNMISVW